MRRLPLAAGALILAAAAPAPQPAQAPAPPAAQASPAAQAKLEQAPPDPALAILGEDVAGPDGKILGRLIDVLVDTRGAPQAAAIDFGGFIGIGSRKIVVPWDALHFASQPSKAPIMLELTPEQLKEAPEYKGAETPIPPPLHKPTSAPASGS